MYYRLPKKKTIEDQSYTYTVPYITSPTMTVKKFAMATSVKYGNPKKGITGMSNRVMLNGGLSPLRWNRTTISEPASINLASAGMVKNNVASQFLSSLPPKNWMFARTASTDASMVQRLFGKQASNGNGMTDIQPLANGTNNPNIIRSAFLDRTQLQHAKRVVIKMGSAVITREDGNGLALGRLASIIEQVAELQNAGRECVLITSGAVAFGRQKLSQELMMSMSMRETLQNNNSKDDMMLHLQKSFSRPNAAVGQSGLQALYETMFRNYGILVGQVLVTKGDFFNETTRTQLFATVTELMALNIIPIINTNDAVSPPPQKEDENASEILGIKDNDSLAARVAVEIKADLAILMSDVDGIFDKPPTHENSRVMHTFVPSDLSKVEFGSKSTVGTGGMESKVNSALWALDNATSVVICNGMKYNTIRKVIKGEKIGTFFTKAMPDGQPTEILAKNARNGSRRLQSLAASDRADIINTIADSLMRRENDIMNANRRDLEAATREGITGPLLSRLALNKGKLESLSAGLKQIAETSHANVGKVIRRTKVSNSMDLVQKTVPIGVLMVIFESRPDALPQVAALAVASANGLLLKGGKEASFTNTVLMSIVEEALGSYGCADAIAMVSGREAVADLLKMDEYIDLVIPRGSGELVKYIKEESKMIPVLGHAEGVCHVYLDCMADPEKALAIVKDAKTDYPSACNAMETLLFHEDLIDTPLFHAICMMLKKEGVDIYAGPKIKPKMTFPPHMAVKMKHEYGGMACTIESVKDVEEAIKHIHKFGSGHTDVIVTESKSNEEFFLDSVDSACVFANCSSRMADGYRLGLGAEVGISTGRIHARGPVGVEGLLTTKWILTGDGDTAADYTSGRRIFTHQPLNIKSGEIDPEANYAQ